MTRWDHFRLRTLWVTHAGPRDSGRAPRVGTVSSLDDTELRDTALHDEIHLVGELIVAASVSDGPLSSGEIDEVLGVADPTPSET